MHHDRILILDDEPLTGQTIGSIAEFAGLQARHTTSAKEFFELVRDWQPGHIALDLIMPDMDGVQVMVRLADLDCRARIIVTSGVGTRVLDAAARSAAEHGLRIAGVLSKPFSPPRLRELLVTAPETDAEYNEEIKGDLPSSRSETGAASDATAAADSPDAGQLQRAVDNSELVLAYQPKLHCRTGILTGFEALVRWQHPVKGLIGPDNFIPLAEQSGLINPLTLCVLEKSLDWLQRLPGQVAQNEQSSYLSRRMESITLSLNISAASLSHLDLFDEIDERCQAHGIDRERLIFELTETSAMEDPVASLDMLTRLRMRGYQLSIDDFGTGYSSMLQLARLPFSEIKVDKSFVMTARESEESRTVVRSIVDLGHGLGLRATAEGIENQETMDYLTGIGCDLAQGYHIARPMTEVKVLEWLAGRTGNDEESRLAVLHAMELLDTPDEERFDRITRLAQRLYDVEISLFSLVDTERQWFKSARGLDVRETPREVSFCSRAIEQDDTMVIEDARQDERFRGNSLVTGFPFICFYAGAAVRAGNGSKLGTLCLIDSRPRSLTPREINLLEQLAGLVEMETEDSLEAIHDPLTGLLNRTGFEKRAARLLDICNRFRLRADMLFIDIDHFHQYNQDQGSAAGDHFLRAFSRLLTDTFREADLVSRFGSDEFVVLLVGRDSDDIHALQDNLRQRFRSVQDRSQGTLDYSSGHAALTHDSGDDLQTLLTRADQKMYADRERTEAG